MGSSAAILIAHRARGLGLGEQLAQRVIGVGDRVPAARHGQKVGEIVIGEGGAVCARRRRHMRDPALRICCI